MALQSGFSRTGVQALCCACPLLSTYMHMAQGKLTSLDEELRGLDASGDGSGREGSAAAETTPVVEADTIVVSGTGRGMILFAPFP